MKLKSFVCDIEATKIVEQLIFDAYIDSGFNLNESVTASCGLVYGNNLVTDNTDEATLIKAKDKLLSIDYTAAATKAGCLAAIIQKLGNVDTGCGDCSAQKADGSKNGKIGAVDSIQKAWNTLVVKYGKDLADPTKTAETFNKMKAGLSTIFAALKG